VEHGIRVGDSMVLSKAFDQFDGSLRAHFAYEEEIARADRNLLLHHKLAQQYFLEELGFLKDELLGKAGVWCGAAVKHYSDLLKGLLVDHITGKDLQMKHILQACPCDFSQAKLVRKFMKESPVRMEVNREKRNKY